MGEPSPSSLFLMKVTGIIKNQSNFYYIRCNEGQFLITLIAISIRMLNAAINLTATATVDFDRPSDMEGFEYWLKDDLEIVHSLLPYQKY
jgi:hypothetical protein